MKQTEEKSKGGRKHTHLVKVYLSDDEYEKLCKDAAAFKRDKSKYLRLLIEWIEPVAPPSVEVKEFPRELRAPRLYFHADAKPPIVLDGICVHLIPCGCGKLCYQLRKGSGAFR